MSNTDVDLLESFALGDRAAVVATLVPGSAQHFEYASLLAEQTGFPDALMEATKSWRDNRSYDDTVRKFNFRRDVARLNLESIAKGSVPILDTISNNIGISQSHSQQLPRFEQESKTSVPDTLNEEVYDTEKLIERLAARGESGFAQLADARFVNHPAFVQAVLKNPAHIHAMFRAYVPVVDVPTMTALLVAARAYYLEEPRTRTDIGSLLPSLSLEQLLAAVQAPSLTDYLKNLEGFVNCVLAAMAPPSYQPISDPQVRERYLATVTPFVEDLPPKFNRLRTHLLFNQLSHHHKHHDTFEGLEDVVIRYASMPRQIYLQKRSYQDSHRELVRSLVSPPSLLVPGPRSEGDEVELLRTAFFDMFTRGVVNRAAIADVVDESWLLKVEAEALILSGKPYTADHVSAVGGPTDLQALANRVEITFAANNPLKFAPADPVALRVWVKNVKTVTVKVFEINTTAYYQDKQAEISTALKLDGMIANEEWTIDVGTPPAVKSAIMVEVPSLAANKRGVFFVELIGNGVSSRAVIRKGALKIVERTTVAGHALRVLDEADNVVDPGTVSVWMSGHHYRADGRGEVVIPFSTSSGGQSQSLVVTATDPSSSWPFSSLATFTHRAESYVLNTAMFVNTQSLVRDNRKATLLLRPDIRLLGSIPVRLDIMTDVSLTIKSTDNEGTPAQRVVRDFKLNLEGETLYDFPVPAGLRELQFTLAGSIKLMANGSTQALSSTYTVPVNRIDNSAATMDVFFRHGGPGVGYVLSILGKSGEPIPNQTLFVRLQHNFVRDTISQQLRSNAAGDIVLGALTDVGSVRVDLSGVPTRTFAVPQPINSLQSAFYTTVGRAPQAVLPIAIPPSALARHTVTLRSASADKTDYFHRLHSDGTFLSVSGLPVGMFTLCVRTPVSHEATITVLDNTGKEEVSSALGMLFGSHEAVELSRASVAPLAITSAVADDAAVFRVHNAGGRPTRVHVSVTRFITNDPNLAAALCLELADVNMTYFESLESRYLNGRELGDEYRYILDRKSQPVFPGNSLPRPSLLLNPWAVGSTETDTQSVRSGDNFADVGSGSGGPHMERRSRRRGPSYGSRSEVVDSGAVAGYYCFDFLAKPAVVALNKAVGPDGTVAIPLSELVPLGGAAFITAVACDGTFSASCNLPVAPAAVAAPYRPLQLIHGLEPHLHIIQQRKVSSLLPGQSVGVTVASDSKAEDFDSLGKVFDLFVTIGDKRLSSEFSFLPKWSTLSQDEKLTKYSKYACHEVNLFVYLKDRAFFDAVVAPFLRCKRVLTFLDHYLLGHDLAPFTSFHKFNSLNAAEKALLCGRLGEAGRMLAATQGGKVDVAPTPTERFDALFRMAIAGNALSDSKAKQSVDDMMASAVTAQRARRMEMAPMPAAPPPPGAPAMAIAMAFSSRSAPMPQLSSKKKAARAVAMDDEDDECEAEECERSEECLDLLSMNEDVDMGRRASGQRQLYQAMDKTQEFAEMHYYGQRLWSCGPELIQVSEFWADLAAHLSSAPTPGPFVSKHLLLATRSLNEALMALAVTDLAMEPKSGADIAVADGKLVFGAVEPMLVFCKDTVEVPEPAETTVLVGQNYFDPSDRYRQHRGSQVDKFITTFEFLNQKVYGCQVVITNVSSAQQNLDVLLQIPAGAIPVANGFVLTSRQLNLSPYSTQKIEYQFYFPELGTFGHYPVHVASEEALVAFARPATLSVVNRPSVIDNTSWEYVSQQGTIDQVLAYLDRENLASIDLAKVCWRLRDAAVFHRVIAVLRRRFAFHDEVWSYSMLHRDVPTMHEFVAKFIDRLPYLGPGITTSLLTVASEAFLGPDCSNADVISFRSDGPAYEHTEFDPLVNARAHRLGKERKIMNKSVDRQYRKLLQTLCYKPSAAVSTHDLMAVTYHMLLQDRVKDAQAVFERVEPPTPTSTSNWSLLQYKYLQAYLDFFSPTPSVAAAIAAEYKAYPVRKWASKFQEVHDQLEEAHAASPVAASGGAGSGDGSEIGESPSRSRAKAMDRLASTEPALSMALEGKSIVLTYANVKTAWLRFYPMDIELLFSNSPFLTSGSGSGSAGSVGMFAYVKPNKVVEVALPPALAGPEEFVIPFPEEFNSMNVMVEATSGGLKASQAYYSNSLRVTVFENYGQVKVTAGDTGAPLPRVYVKCYSRRSPSDAGQFYKDGYTDIRGRFDFTSLNTDELSHVERFALLVSSDSRGAVVREARPPKS